MKYKNLFSIMGLAIAAAITFTACSQDEIGSEEKTVTEAVERNAEGMYTYTMQFDCEAPAFDANETRATTDWANNSKIYLKFGNIAGTATYNSSSKKWTVTSNSSLSITTNETECECFYFENNTLPNSTAYKRPVYGGKGMYTHPTSSDIIVKGKLQPICWRLKFEGGSVTLKGSQSEIYYLSSFDTSTATFSQPSPFEDITLSNGEYIYGVFAKDATEAKLSVKSDDTYNRTLNTSNLGTGESGVLTRPTKSNYQSLGWTSSNSGLNASPTSITFSNEAGSQLVSITGNDKWTASSSATSWCTLSTTTGTAPSTLTVKVTANNSESERKATVTIKGTNTGTTITINVTQQGKEPPFNPNAWMKVGDFVAFNDGFVTDWTFGSEAKTFTYVVAKNGAADNMTDEELYEILEEEDFFSEDIMDNLFRNNSEEFYSPNSQYVIVGVARDSRGNRGPILKYSFKTLATSLPYAQISNVKYDTSTKKKWTFDIAMKNNAKGYYLATNASEDIFNSDWHWYAYNVHYWATSGDLEVRTWTSVTSTLSSGTCNVLTICTWGVSSSNSIGNCNVAYGSVRSSSRQAGKSSSSRYGTISKDVLKKQMESTKVYFVE